MKTTILILAFASISIISFEQENNKQDSTLAITDRPFQQVNFNAPLYFLENKEIAYADVNKIDTDKIEAITVLKDSSAVVKYGERARHGVVIISLKQNKLQPGL